VSYLIYTIMHDLRFPVDRDCTVHVSGLVDVFWGLWFMIGHEINQSLTVSGIVYVFMWFVVHDWSCAVEFTN